MKLNFIYGDKHSLLPLVTYSIYLDGNTKRENRNISYSNTERRERVGSNPPSCPGGPDLKHWPGYRISWTKVRCFVQPL